jgi:hypothetical protein
LIITSGAFHFCRTTWLAEGCPRERMPQSAGVHSWFGAMPPSYSRATSHDSGAIIWPGANSNFPGGYLTHLHQQSCCFPGRGGTPHPRLRGGPGRGWPGSCPTHSHQPSCCFPHAAERKGAVMLSEAKHLKSRPTKTPRSHPNLLPQCPRSASVRARAGAVCEPPLLRCGSLAIDA